MKKILFLSLMVLSIVTIFLLNSCASSCQRMKANGSIIGTTNGDWIVIKQSGGHITDVYKLEDVMVQSEEGSDGWLFLDQDGNPVHIGGDMKAIRVVTNKKEIFNSYVEYHMEFDTISYQEKYKLYQNENVNYIRKKL
jgi:hypothetical protein